jgi:hypothetical protein
MQNENRDLERQRTLAGMKMALNLLDAADFVLGEVKVNGTPFYELYSASSYSMQNVIEDLAVDIARFESDEDLSES